MQSMYVCIDFKSFYASVECVDRGLDPMKTNLVVADPERTDKTVCLAITPAMKALGIKNRCRVFEIQKNIEYIMAPPRMKRYIEVAADIYGIYLDFVSKDDIHVYSVDEVFIDVTHYLSLYNITAKEMGKRMIDEVFKKLGIRSACGVGTNLYLAKIALDITAKHSPDFIGELDEHSFKEKLWHHTPLTDFWMIGKNTEKTLNKMGIRTMYDIAHFDEEKLYEKFGVNAELLIDHANGIEPTTIKDIKTYKSKTRSLSSGQVLMRDYEFKEGEIIVKEMMELLCLDMSENDLETKSVTLQVGYSNKLDVEPARGTISVRVPTNSSSELVHKVAELYRNIVNPEFPVRRINISCNNLSEINDNVQVSMFDGEKEYKKDTKIQKAMVGIKKQFGKNAVFKAIDLEESATTLERNRQIGGHKSGEK